MIYKITVISNWIAPQIIFTDSLETAKEIRREFRDQQYLVEIEEIDDSVVSSK